MVSKKVRRKAEEAQGEGRKGQLLSAFAKAQGIPGFHRRALQDAQRIWKKVRKLQALQTYRVRAGTMYNGFHSGNGGHDLPQGISSRGRQARDALQTDKGGINIRWDSRE